MPFLATETRQLLDLQVSDVAPTLRVNGEALVAGVDRWIDPSSLPPVEYLWDGTEWVVLGQAPWRLVRANAAATYDLDLTSGNHFELTLQDDTAFTLSGATAGQVSLMQVHLFRGAGAYTPSWPVNLAWLPGSSPDVASLGDGNSILLLIWSTDGGTTWYGQYDSGGGESGSGGSSELQFASGLIGDGSSTSLTYSHNLGSTRVLVQCYDESGVIPELVIPSAVTVQSTNMVGIEFAVAPGTNEIRVNVIAGPVEAAIHYEVAVQATEPTEYQPDEGDLWLDVDTVFGPGGSNLPAFLAAAPGTPTDRMLWADTSPLQDIFGIAERATGSLVQPTPPLFIPDQRLQMVTLGGQNWTADLTALAAEGWTVLFDVDLSSNEDVLVAYRIVSGVNNPVTIEATNAIDNQNVVTVVETMSDVVVSDSAYATTPDAPSLVGTTGQLLICGWLNVYSSTAFDAGVPAGFTEVTRLSEAVTNTGHAVIAMKRLTADGATGAQTLAGTSTAYDFAFSILLTEV